VSCACTPELRSACSTVPSSIVVPVVVLMRRTTTPTTPASETKSAISATIIAGEHALIVVAAGPAGVDHGSVLSLPSGIVSPGCQFETVVRSAGGSAGVPSSRSSL
jgi:hypothetical protein